jgi:hypothetical protein
VFSGGIASACVVIPTEHLVDEIAGPSRRLSLGSIRKDCTAALGSGG